VIREAVQQVLENPSYREKAIIISDGLKKCTGAKGAADKILQVLNN
jgi:UDP:flavonoid glycosyltransferase YjiC (YdhE family)